MPTLGEVAPLDDWGRRESPTYAAFRLVSVWVANLANHPWQYPSVLLEELSLRP
ncbi:MAG: hypothetical protein ACYDH5_08245 [Acidimicrobiales bacterium]